MYNHHLPGKVTPSLGDLSWLAKHIKILFCLYSKKKTGCFAIANQGNECDDLKLKGTDLPRPIMAINVAVKILCYLVYVEQPIFSHSSNCMSCFLKDITFFL